MKTRLERLFNLLDYYNFRKYVAAMQNKTDLFKHYSSRVVKIQMYIINNYKHKNAQYE